MTTLPPCPVPLPPPSNKAAAIVRRSDAGEYPDDIAAAVDCSTGYVYQVLREHRPERARKPRAKTSALRQRILLAKAEGKEPGVTARELAGQCSRAYVYAIWSEHV